MVWACRLNTKNKQDNQRVNQTNVARETKHKKTQNNKNMVCASRIETKSEKENSILKKIKWYMPFGLRQEYF